MIPTLTTDRLILRGPTRADFDAFAEMMASDRAKYMGGPMDRAEAWRIFAVCAAGWPLDGFGNWIITDRETGTFLGDVGTTFPIRFPEPELGWTLIAEAEGKGYAREAATAARDWYWANTEARSVVSYLHPQNDRSIALAKRLGATRDADAPLPDGETPEETVVYRHRRPS